MFEIAFAVSLALGTNPKHVTFDTSEMCQHLTFCLKAKKVSMFPVFKQLFLFSDSKHRVKLLTMGANNWTGEANGSCNMLWYPGLCYCSRPSSRSIIYLYLYFINPQRQ